MKMMLLKFICFGVFGLHVVLAQAQSEEKLKEGKYITFDEQLHDFGRINQVDGDIEFEFLFTNSGSRVVRILDAIPECGCTLPDLTLIKDSTLAPGQKAGIPIVYEASTHPGEFDKRIEICTSLDTFEIGIRGYVVPDQSESSRKYPELLGDVRFEERSLQLGKVFSHEPVKRTFNFFNPNNDTLFFDIERCELPNHIKLNFSPESTPPNAVGHLIITYDPVIKADFGYVVDYIKLQSNLDTLNFVEIPVRASIEEYFDPNLDTSKSAKLAIEKAYLVHSFSETKSGDQVKYEIPFENGGQENLIIHTIKGTCSCVVASADKKVYKPGQKGVIAIVFDTTKRSGMQRKQVVVYSNDPLTPVTTLKLEGRVSQ